VWFLSCIIKFIKPISQYPILSLLIHVWFWEISSCTHMDHLDFFISGYQRLCSPSRTVINSFPHFFFPLSLSYRQTFECILGNKHIVLDFDFRSYAHIPVSISKVCSTSVNIRAMQAVMMQIIFLRSICMHTRRLYYAFHHTRLKSCFGDICSNLSVN